MNSGEKVKHGALWSVLFAVVFAGVDLPDRAGDHQLFQAEGVYFS